MGCKLTKDETIIADSRDTATDMSKPSSELANNGNVPSASAIKSKVEKKMCLAKETPEPIFDLSECYLKECPSGVFVLCKVLRKEVLLLHRNQLTSLRGGGQIVDLSLIRILDLRENKLKTLPEELSELPELRELFLSNNLLERLPQSLHRMHRLEILDVAHNKLTTVADIKQLANLRVLLLNGNSALHVLAASLATCESLNDLVIDTETLDEPPALVCEQGTKAILNYLMAALRTHDMPGANVAENVPKSTEESLATKLFLEREQLDQLVVKHLDANRITYQLKTNELLASERMALEKHHVAEEAARNEQDARRVNLLKEIREQQDLQTSQINELNTQKNENRTNLIRDIMEEEERWKGLVQQSIEIKSFVVDPLLLEQEANEQTRLLDHMKMEQAELRKQDILRAMEDLLETELQQVEMYQRQKAASSTKVLTKETEKMHLLTDVFEGYSQNRNKVVEQILNDESVQKSAVATLISRKDARSWALIEQMRIIESHLGAISTFELEKRRDGTNQQLSDLAERRMMLSQVLMELMEQQDRRKKELIEMLARMESARDDDLKDFWLMQYQRLLDTQPENVNFDCHVDSELGYNFLVNGVVHCLPFLTRLWQDESKALHEIVDDDLKAAGIRQEADRIGILKSIAQFLEHRQEKSYATEQRQDEAVAKEVLVDDDADDKTSREVDQEEQLAECVICMDKRVKIIFLLCGHLACCEDCHDSVNICPICRAPIQQRIRVIQA